MSSFVLLVVGLFFLFTKPTAAQDTSNCPQKEVQALAGYVHTQYACTGGIETFRIIVNESIQLQSWKTKPEEHIDIQWFNPDIVAGDHLCIVVDLWHFNRETTCSVITDPLVASTPKVEVPHETTSADCGVSPPRFESGEKIRVPPAGTDSVLRQEASTTSGFLGTVPVGTLLTVLSGPSCGENAAWYQVSYKNQVGWIAASYAGILHLEKAP